MARLYVRNDEANRLAATFHREGQLAGKRALRHMRQVANLVMKQSIANSPVDWKGPRAGMPPGHELERSHRVEEQYAQGRIEATVVIGGNVGGVNVDRYAEWLHESFSWNLGPASRRKMMQSAKNKVGPLFLERALAEYDAEFEDWGGQILDDLIEGLL